MQLCYILLDERLDSVLAAERRAGESVRRDFRQRFLWSWIYHELSLEGVVLRAEDIERALVGRHGMDYRDEVLLDTIRAYHGAIQRVREMAFRREPLTVEAIFDLHRRLVGAAEPQPLRDASGPTEAYKHDVLEPNEIRPALDRLVAQLANPDLLAHPLHQAISAQHRLAKIWPFAKYSGALARLVSHYLMLTHGWPPALLATSERQAWYHSLHYDISRLHEVVLHAVGEQLDLRARVFRRRPESAYEARAY